MKSFKVILFPILFLYCATTLANNLFKQSEIVDASCSNKFCVSVGSFVTSYDNGGWPIKEPLLIEFTEANSNWKIVNSFQNLPEHVYFNKVSCSSDVCVVIGHIAPPGGGTDPLAMVSTIDGKAWKVITQFEGSGPFAKLTDVSCDAKSCVIVASNAFEPPLIFQSSDAGTTWNYRSKIKNLPNNFKIESIDNVSCKAGYCAATAQTQSEQFIIQSSDAGVTWKYVDSVSSTSLHFEDISCAADVCVAVANAGSTASRPRIYQTNNHGQSWDRVIVLDNDLISVQMTHVECKNKTCVATAEQSDGARLIETTNAGKSWNIKYIKNVSRPEDLAASCTNQFCVAVGGIVGSYDAPHLLAHKELDKAWAVSTDIPANLTGRLGFQGVTCNETRCIAFSQDNLFNIQLVQSFKSDSWVKVDLGL